MRVFGINRTRPDWKAARHHWPHSEKSRFVRSGPINWHVQMDGPPDAPTLLLVHGTGASAHSFRDMLPLLAQSFRVVVPDLPGHGFTDARSDEVLSLPGMAKALAGLCDTLEVTPRFAVGHSAGTAVLIQMVLAQDTPCERIIGINSALRPIEGNAVLSPLAKLFFANPMIPRLVSWRAGSGDMVGSLLARTGSTLDERGVRCYRTLVQNPAHVAGALGMMANWDLDPMRRRFGELALPMTFITAGDDPMVPPEDSREAAGQIENAELVNIRTGGHLLHEVAPEKVAEVILERCSRKR